MSDRPSAWCSRASAALISYLSAMIRHFMSVSRFPSKDGGVKGENELVDSEVVGGWTQSSQDDIPVGNARKVPPLDIAVVARAGGGQSDPGVSSLILKGVGNPGRFRACPCQSMRQFSR